MVFLDFSPIYTIYVYKGKKKSGKSGLTPLDYAHCEKCDRFYKIRLEIKEE